MTSLSIGLCKNCLHHEMIESAKGSAFHKCALAESDPGFVRYPPLPVTTCGGFERRAPHETTRQRRDSRG